MHLEPLYASIASRCRRIRSGLAVGFGGAGGVADALRELRGGVWMEAEDPADLPFEDHQFEVVVLDGAHVSRANVREANRVLKSDGHLFFIVAERTGSQDGFTSPEIYKVVREGFDILEVRRPKWWTFGRRGKTLTVCARKKAWREHKSFAKEGKVPFTPFRSRA